MLYIVTLPQVLGRGFMEPDALVEALAPPLDAQEGVYLQVVAPLDLF